MVNAASECFSWSDLILFWFLWGNYNIGVKPAARSPDVWGWFSLDFLDTHLWVWRTRPGPMVHCRDRSRTSVCTSTRAIHGPHTSLQRTIGPSLPGKALPTAAPRTIQPKWVQNSPPEPTKIPTSCTTQKFHHDFLAQSGNLHYVQGSEIPNTECRVAR